MQLLVKTHTVLPYKDGRYVPHKLHDPVLVEDLSDALQARIAAGCPFVAELLG